MILPPLNALRAFEAAARHLSFTKAAAELNVTQAAISHRIAALEDQLGVPLFRRVGRAIMLTDAAQSYLPAVRDAFERLASATRRLKVSEASGILEVSILPSFAAKWLLPRISRFHAAYPDIDVRLSTSFEVVDFSREDFDCAVRTSHIDVPGLRVDLLMSESLFPVCSPRLLAGGPPLDAPHDLRHYTLLHEVDEGQNWREWLMLVGVPDFDWQRGPGYSDSSMVIEAAVQGQGVALARGALAVHDLSAGRLVRPFSQSLPNVRSYYFVSPENGADRPKVTAFRNWLKQEAYAATAQPSC